MTLDAEQRRRTGAELHANLTRSGLTAATVAQGLGLDAVEVARALDVDPAGRPEVVWWVRDHLHAAVLARGGEPVPFTVLTEDVRASAERWFPLRRVSRPV